MPGWTRLSTYASGYSSGQLASVAFNGNVSAGSLFIVDLFWESSATVPTVSDTLGNGNYAQIGSTQHVAGGGYSAMFWMVNTKGAGANTVNFTAYGSGASYTLALITEYSTPGGTISANGSSGNAFSGTSYGTTITSNSFSTTQSGCLIHAMSQCFSNSGTGPYAALTQGSGFTFGQVYQVSFDYLALADEYQVQSSSGSIAGTFVIGASSGTFLGEVICAAFYATGGGGRDHSGTEPHDPADKREYAHRACPGGGVQYHAGFLQLRPCTSSARTSAASPRFRELTAGAITTGITGAGSGGCTG